MCCGSVTLQLAVVEIYQDLGVVWWVYFHSLVCPATIAVALVSLKALILKGRFLTCKVSGAIQLPY